MISSKRIANIFLSIFFIAVLLAPAIAKRLDLGTQTEAMIREKENRLMVPKPRLFGHQFDISELHRYPKRISEYLLDIFPYRLQITSVLFDVQRDQFGRQGDRGIFGKGNWLFYNESDAGSRAGSITNYIGNGVTSEKAAAAYFERLERKRKFFADRGIRYYFLIAPNKVTIHDEYLPDSLREARGKSFRETFMAYYRDRIRDEGIPDFVVDPTDALIARKAWKSPLYFAQDAHWNWEGRLVAARVLCDRLRRDFPGVGEMDRAMRMVERPGWTYLVGILNVDAAADKRGEAGFPDPFQWGDVEGLLHDPAAWPWDSPFYHDALYRNRRRREGGIDIIMVGDSFWNGYHPVPEIWAVNSIFMRSRQYKNDDFVYSVLKYYEMECPGVKPDAVIEEIVERNFLWGVE